MMRLRRVYETAEEENRPVEEVALERFGSLEAFDHAREERRILDEREGRRAERGRGKGKGQQNEQGMLGKGGEKGMMFTDLGGSGVSSRSSSFKRPVAFADSVPSTPSRLSAPPVRQRFDSLRLSSQGHTSDGSSHTPIPSVMTPQIVSASGRRALSPSSLNKLQAKVLRAKLMGAPDAEALEKEYDEEMRRANGEVNKDGVRTRVEVLPTLDARGRLYDVGHGKADGPLLPGNKKMKEKV